MSGKRRSSRGSGLAAGTEELRAVRVGEKKELNDLNKRLEQYILTQRDRDASLDNLRALLEEQSTRHAEEMRKKSEDYDAEIERLSAALSEAEAQLSLLRKDAEEFDERLAKAEVARDQFAEKAEMLEETVREKDQSMNALSTDLESVQNDLLAAEQRVEAAQGQVTALEAQLAELLAQGQNQEKELGKLRRLLADANERMTGERDAHLADLAVLRQQLSAAVDAQGSEREIRRKVADELAEEFKTKLDAVGAERDQAIEELSRVYKQTVSGYRDDLEELGCELKQAQQSEAEKANALEAAESELDELQKSTAALLKRQEKLEQQVRELSSRPEHDDLSERDAIIHSLKDSYKKKCEEFDRLMDVKIALAMEIQAYRRLLAAEEARLDVLDAQGFQSPAKKRRTGGGPVDIGSPDAFLSPRLPLPPSGSALSSVRSPMASPPNEEMMAVLVGMKSPGRQRVRSPDEQTRRYGGGRIPVFEEDFGLGGGNGGSAVPEGELTVSGSGVHGQFLTVRNTGITALTLSGWSLRSKGTGQSFQFPDGLQLHAGERFTVYPVGEGDEEPNAKKLDEGKASGVQAGAKWAVWKAEADEKSEDGPQKIWAESGDQAELVDPKGRVKTSVDIVPVFSFASLRSPVHTLQQLFSPLLGQPARKTPSGKRSGKDSAKRSGSKKSASKSKGSKQRKRGRKRGREQAADPESTDGPEEKSKNCVVM